MRHRAIAVSAAFGAGIGTIIAVALQQHHILGAVIGALLGAIVGGLSFRPNEVARVVWQTYVRNRRAFGIGVIGVAFAIGLLFTSVHWMGVWWHAPLAIGVAVTLVAAWRHRSVVGPATLRVLGKLLAVVWACSLLTFGACILPMLAAAVGWVEDPLTLGLLMMFAAYTLLALEVRMLLVALARWSRSKRLWAWMGTRLVCGAFGITAVNTDANRDSGPLVPESWGRVRVDGRILRPRALVTLGRYSAWMVSLGLVAPFLAALLVLAPLVDVPVTIILALASSERVAVMEGAFLGALAGAAVFHTSAMVAPAVALGVVLGALAGVGLFHLRQHLDHRAPATV